MINNSYISYSSFLFFLSFFVLFHYIVKQRQEEERTLPVVLVMMASLSGSTKQNISCSVSTICYQVMSPITTSLG